MMHWWYGDGHMGWMGIWWIVGAAVIALVIWALIRYSRVPLNSSSESPDKILKRRFAKGDIDHATYKRMLTELKG